MRKSSWKNDIIFIGILAAVCVVIFLIFMLQKSDGSGWVVVTVDGEEYGRYRLSEEQEIEITDADGNVTNWLEISDGKANMTAADCPDKLCVKQGTISRTGENIVCLPNRVVVSVERGKEDGLDAIAQ
ncbi:MAG: NusG domain II-containing protein [Clostridiales bacterium]|nr:NusG domain II-containing protein [Clostridiales bacterium]